MLLSRFIQKSVKNLFSASLQTVYFINCSNTEHRDIPESPKNTASVGSRKKQNSSKYVSKETPAVEK